MSRTLTKRQFLHASAGAAAGCTVLASPRSAAGFTRSDCVRLAVFGGEYNAGHVLGSLHALGADVVALCNPDRRQIPETLAKFAAAAEECAKSSDPTSRAAEGRYRQLAAGEGVRIFSDVRKLFDEMAEEIDAFVVSDFDHFHGIACGEALRAGKPVCSERPLGFTIADARALRALAAETALPTTYRSPGTATDSFRRALELVDDGAIGDVREVEVWFDRGGADREALPAGQRAVPEGLEWDLWLGPLAKRPYHPDWMAYGTWREMCSGGLGIFGPHTAIFPFLALNLGALWEPLEADGDDPPAIRVSAECSRLNRISFPVWERVRWEVPARGKLPAVTVTWHQGPNFGPGACGRIRDRLRRFGVADDAEADALIGVAGSMLIGSEGAMVGNDHSVKVACLPKDRFAGAQTRRPERTAGSHGIYRDWLDACRGTREPHILASFENGGPLSEFLMLGNIATQFPGEEIAFDPASGSLVHAPPEAENLTRYAYRAGWRI